MKIESMFVWGLAFAVALLIAFVAVILTMALVIAWRQVTKKAPSVEMDADLQKKIDEARRGGSQTSDFE